MDKFKGIALTILKILVALYLIGFVLNMTVFKDAGSSSKEETTQESNKPANDPEPQPEQEQAPEPESEPEPEPSAQVFNTDFGTLEYRSIQDAVGNAVVTFMFTNKTGVTVSGYIENLVVNNQFNVQALGGVQSLSGINAGNSGAVTITFGVPTQTTLESVSEITSLSGDLRVYPQDSVTETIGYIHFDVVV